MRTGDLFYIAVLFSVSGPPIDTRSTGHQLRVTLSMGLSPKPSAKIILLTTKNTTIATPPVRTVVQML